MSDSSYQSHLTALVKHNPASALTFIADQLEPSPQGNLLDLVTLNVDESELILLLSAARRALYMLDVSFDLAVEPIVVLPDSTWSVVFSLLESQPAHVLSFLSSQFGLLALTDSQRFFIVRQCFLCVDKIERVSLFGENGGNYAYSS